MITFQMQKCIQKDYAFTICTLHCIGQPEKFKASDEGKVFLCNSTFLNFKTGKINVGKYNKSTLSKNVTQCKRS